MYTLTRWNGSIGREGEALEGKVWMQGSSLLSRHEYTSTFLKHRRKVVQYHLSLFDVQVPTVE